MRLNAQGQTAEEANITYRIEPSEYLARQADVDIDVYGTVKATAIGTSRGGEGEVAIPRSFAFDVRDRYEAQLILNRGTPAEVRSDKLEIPLWQRIIRRVGSSNPFRGGSSIVGEGPGVFVSQEVDAVNNAYCSTGTDFIFELSREGRVTLTFTQIDSLNADGTPELGLEITLIDHQLYGAGEHHQTITPGDLPAGDYRYELRVVSPLDGQEEVVVGPALSEYQLRSSLSVGHVLVKEVDLFDGHLVVQRDDFEYPGRGVPLRFARTYASNNAGDSSLMGTGWTHSYMVKLVVTPCGEVILVGGDGSGQRFRDVGEAELVPMKGHHGSLLVDRAAKTFDFYSKNGNRSHFRYFSDNEYYLLYIEDPNGNKTELLYAADMEHPRVETVRDPGGRELRFGYEEREFKFWEGPVLLRVSGPGGIGMTFEYDGYGNLIWAAREGPEAESYEYQTPLAGEETKGRHLMIAAIDAITGAKTTYAYEHGVIGIQGEIQVEIDCVVGMKEPEGGVSSFAYDLVALSDREVASLTSTATDRRGQTTIYELSQYGRSRRIEDPEGNVTRMEWSENDVVMTARIDANGVRTDYGYDQYANLTSESVTVTHVDGEEVTYLAESTYRRMGYIKDRIVERTDRNGHTTYFDYDGKGNLLEERIEVGNVGDATLETLTLRHTYNDAGDRLSTEDRRGNMTFFRYDVYGNVSEVTDSMGGVTTAEWDVRSLPILRTDALGRETVLEYDTLGRLIRRVLPEVVGEGTVAEQILYDDAHLRRTEIDAEGRSTVTDFDLEGRVVEITNAAGGTKVFDYDVEGNKIVESSWFDSETPRHDTTFEYDDAGRLERRLEPLGRVTDYAYDGVGNVWSETLVDSGDGSYCAASHGVVLRRAESCNRGASLAGPGSG